MKTFLIPALTVLMGCGVVLAEQPPSADPNEAIEKTLKAAVTKAAPWTVQIETQGGIQKVGGGRGTLKGVGPVTGLVVSADGYVISSAFNFSHKPAAIFVSFPSLPANARRKVADVVATDHTRMLSLLKVREKIDGLPVPVAAAKKELEVGQWALALGRTLADTDKLPSVSNGIISALDRIWGKAVQTDAKVSPINYGGPLIDVHGRVIGVLVPASPQAEGDTAGIEWYDSGIGFAVPLEDVFAVLPRLKAGQDLRRGLLGITPKSQDRYGARPEIGTVANDSPAAKAGLKPGDLIVKVADKPVANFAQLQHALGPKYENDPVTVVVKRGDQELTFKDIPLSGATQGFEHSFLGILPMRDDPSAGVEVRYVYAKSPAEAAGIKAGDRILKLGPAAGMPALPLREFKGRDELQTLLNGLSPNTPVKLEIKRPGSDKTEVVSCTLAKLPVDVPAQLPEKASAGKATAIAEPKDAPKKDAPKKDDEKKLDTGLIERKNALGREYWAYVPANYDPNLAHGLVIWLHPAGGRKDRDIKEMRENWEDFCADNHLILLGPRSANDTGWQPSEIDFIRESAKEIMDVYRVDKQRIVAHGMGVGGQMAFYLGFNARDLVRGVATTGAVLGTQPKDNLPQQRLAFFIVCGEKDPLLKDIAESQKELEAFKYPVLFRELKGMGKQYLDEPTLKELARWIDSLDRL